MSCHNSHLSSVLFVSTCDVYAPNQSLVCKFTVNDEELQCFDETCWIGIFKVGWESLSDFVCRKFLPTKGQTEPGIVLFSNSTEDVCFEATEIPQENDEEFYQFCFITGKGVVLGASCPFQITQNTNNGSLSGSLLDLSAPSSDHEKAKPADGFDLEWCPWLEISGEDVDDAVLVHNKTTLLEKSLAKVIQENNILRASIEGKESDLENLNDQLLEAQNEICNTRDILSDKRKQQDFDIEQIDKITQELSNAKDQEEKLKRQVHEMSKVAKNLGNDLLRSKEEIEALVEQLAKVREAENMKREECDVRNRQSLASLKEMEDAILAGKEALKTAEAKHRDELESMNVSLVTALSELAASKECVQKLQLEKNNIISQIYVENTTLDNEKKDLVDTVAKKEMEVAELEKKLKYLSKTHQEDLKNLQENLANKVVAQKSMVEQMQETANDLQNCKEENNILEQEIQKLKDRNTETETCIEILNCKLEEMREDNYLLKEKADGHNGARHALQVAYVHTQRQLAQLRGERDTITHQYQSFRQQSMDSENDDVVRELKKQVEDLKLRLCIGANAYREKYMESRRLQSEMKRIKIVSSKRSQEQNLVGREDDHQSRARIICKVNANEGSNHKDLPDLMKAGSEAEHDTKDKILELQNKLETKDAKLHQVKQNYERSLLKVTGEVQALQDKIFIKDDMLQNARNATEEARREADSLRKQLTVFQQIRYPEPSAMNHPQPADLAHCQGATALRSPTSREPPTASLYGSQDQPHNYKIFHPPESILDSRSLCLEDPYVDTLRPAVSLSTATGNAEALSPTGYPYKSKPAGTAVVPSGQVGPTSAAYVTSSSTFECPVCALIFPTAYSELAASNHVNSHFPEVSERATKKIQRKK